MVYYRQTFTLHRLFMPIVSPFPAEEKNKHEIVVQKNRKLCLNWHTHQDRAPPSLTQIKSWIPVGVHFNES